MDILLISWLLITGWAAYLYIRRPRQTHIHIHPPTGSNVTVERETQ